MNPNFFRYVGGVIFVIAIVVLLALACVAARAGGVWLAASAVLAWVAYRIARTGYKYIILGGA